MISVMSDEGRAHFDSPLTRGRDSGLNVLLKPFPHHRVRARLVFVGAEET
jgi:hypothetical protein